MDIREAEDDLRDEEFPEEDSTDGGEESSRPCPSCGTAVHELCDHCPCCGHWIVDDEERPSGRLRVFFIVAAALAILALVWYILQHP